jgi:hypothetical protein
VSAMADEQRVTALRYIQQTIVLSWRIRDLLTEVGDQGEGGEITAVLRILEDVQAMLGARHQDALRQEKVQEET